MGNFLAKVKNTKQQHDPYEENIFIVTDKNIDDKDLIKPYYISNKKNNDEDLIIK